MVKGNIDYRATTRYVLGIVAGAIILFPTIFTAISPPYILSVFLILFWVFSFFSFIFLAIAFHVASLSEFNTPVVPTGLGNNFAFLGLMSLFIFISGNIISDRYAKPHIVELTASPSIATINGIISLEAIARDNDGDRLVWDWTSKLVLDESGNSVTQSTVASPDILSNIRTAQFIVAHDTAPGLYQITVFADDGRKSETQSIFVRVSNE